MEDDMVIMKEKIEYSIDLTNRHENVIQILLALILVAYILIRKFR